MGAISLIRHGQASFGKADYDQLTELGYRQGEQLGHWFNQCEQKLDKVVVGGLKRHKQTADSCMQKLHPQLHPDDEWEFNPGFNEYDHIEMLHRQEPRFSEAEFVKDLFVNNQNPRRAFQKIFVAAFQRWVSGQHDQDYVESWPAFKRRCIEAFESLMQGERSQHIAVFTSGGAISVIIQHLLSLPDEGMAALNSSIANGSISRVLFKPGTVTLSSFNNYAHFEQQPDSGLLSYR